MHTGIDLNSIPELDYEDWIDALSLVAGRYTAKVTNLKAFAGRARVRSICGLDALDLEHNAYSVERTHRDVRLDGMEHYTVVFQIAGRSTIVQKDQIVELAVGDVALVDAAQPVTHFQNERGQLVFLQLPRLFLRSQLGFEPQGGVCGRGGTLAAHLLFQLVSHVGEDEDSPVVGTTYMRLVVSNLLGALFAPSDPVLSTDKLFRRICGIIKDRFADPDFGPRELAVEANISPRYLQKLFMARGSTCNHLINSLRLDHAKRLLHQRVLLNTSQPVGEIAYACGFRSYNNFARQFRRRFGHRPGLKTEDQ